MSFSFLSIILPACNESAAISSTIRGALKAFPDAEVLVVNDGSTDSTQLVAEAAGAKVISHPKRRGNGAAIKTGARAARGEILVFMDADGQHNPADIHVLLEKLDEGYDMVVGARSGKSQASIGRRIANWFYNRMATYMTGQQIDDLTSGFRAVRAEKFRQFLYLLPNGFSYPTTCTMAFFRAGYGVSYIWIDVAKRIGKSHISVLKDGARFLLIIFKIGTLFSPLKLFLPVSLFMTALASGWYCYTFVSLHRFTNMSALLYSGAVVTFMMGLISEQITALMYKDMG